MLPLLLPALITVPLVGLLVFLLAGQWHARDERAAATARVDIASAAISTELHAAVQRQRGATELLSRSPMVWLWVKFQGERLTASNRSHAQMALKEAANYGRLLPGAAVYMASDKTRILYRDGSAVGALSPNEARNAWYFTALTTEGIVLSADTRQVRASQRIMEGTRLLGAVTCVRDAASLAAGAFSAVGDGSGVIAVIADGGGGVVRAAGTAAGGTVFDLFDAAAGDALRSAMKEAARPGQAAHVMTRMQGRPMLASVTCVTDPPGWYLVVGQEASLRMPLERTLLLIIVPVAALAALLAALIVIISGRMSWAAARMQKLEQERDAAAGGFTQTHAAAARVQTGLAGLGALAGSLAREAEGAARSGAAAVELFARMDERDGELRSGLAGRISLMEQLTAAARESIERSRTLAAAADAMGRHAANGEEELSRLIASGEALSAAVRKSARGVEAVEEAAGHVKLLSLNAAIDAQRSGGPESARIAGDIGRRAEEAASRARELADSVHEAETGMEAVTRAAREAGRRVHDAAVSSREAARSATGAREGADTLLSRMAAAGISAEQLHDRATCADQERSAIEGIGRIIARIAALGRQIAGIADRASGDSAEAARVTRDGQSP